MKDARLRAGALGVLTWLDTIERLDTLLLEMRHFQCNVIFSLRLPILYQALTFEESYLWGEFSTNLLTRALEGSTSIHSESWFKIFDDIRSSAVVIRELANAWVIRFPFGTRRSGCSEFAKGFTDVKTRKTIEDNIRMIVQKVNRTGRWSMDARRHYYNLCTVQVIKANVLRDKLRICQCGHNTFRHFIEGKAVDFNSAEFNNLVGEFMIMRSAVIMRLNNYVERFGDLQAQFHSFLDLSLQEDPPPTIRRRQEQGFYTSFLSRRCREVQEAIDDLLCFLHPEDESNRDIPLVMQRWRHDFTSSTEYLHDDAAEEDQPRSDIQFINSSYWMPDRPDLLSVLAHELAHQEIAARYHNFRSPFLDIEDDPLARLAKLLTHCFASFGIPPENVSTDPRNRPESALLEIASDLIAAGVEGHAYLYALFLELTTCELGSIMELPDGRIDLDLRVGLDPTGDPDRLGHSWYVRLRILCAWLEAIHHRESGPIVSLLVKGIEYVLDAVLHRMGQNAPAYQQHVPKWEALAHRLCTLVRRSSAASKVRQWREQRAKHAQRPQGILRDAPRFDEPLNIDLRNFLLRMFVQMKCAPGRLLHLASTPTIKDLIPLFEQKYLGEKLGPPPADGCLLHNDSLYLRHIYDLPWECAILSAIDFVHEESRAKEAGWLNLFHHQSAMGRELYKIALEFYVQHSRPAADHLATAVRVVMRLLQDLQRPWADDISALELWLCGKNHEEFDTHRFELWKQVIDAVAKKGHSPTPRDPYRTLMIDNELKLVNYSYIVETTPALALKEAHPTGFSEYTDLLQNAIQDEERLARQLLETFKNVDFDEVRHSIKRRLKFKRNDRHLVQYTIERLQGEKLDSLLRLILDHKLTVKYKQLKELELYLQLWHSKNGSANGDVHRDSTMWLLLRSLDQRPSVESGSSVASRIDHLKAGVCESRCVQIGRVTLAGDIALPNDCGKGKQGSLGSPITILESPRWARRRREELVLSQRVLGRFDIVTLQRVRRMSRAGLPWFERVGKPLVSDERFYPFLMRQEICIPCRLNLDEEWPLTLRGTDPPATISRKLKETTIFGFLSVVLVERPARLTFLARLLRMKNIPVEKSLVESCRHSHGNQRDTISDVARRFGHRDCIFLGEGWGDIIIVFVDEPNANRLDDIFTIQNAIFQDFLVDRTEITLTPACWEEATRRPCEYDIKSFFRIRSDRELRWPNENFSRGMKRVINYYGKPEDLYFRKIPGTIDFALDWTHLYGDTGHVTPEVFLEKVREAGVDREIDDIMTIISRKERPTL